MTLPHRVFGTRLSGVREGEVAQPDPAFRRTPLVTVTGIIDARQYPDCDDCPAATVSLCRKALRERQPFPRPECNMTPVKRTVGVRAELARRVWDYCVTHEQFTVADLARGVNITLETARTHMRKMEVDGRVTKTGRTFRHGNWVDVYTATTE